MNFRRHGLGEAGRPSARGGAIRKLVAAAVSALALSVGASHRGFAREPDTRLGLPSVPEVAGNPQTPRKIALGRRLFFDTRLSANAQVSCSTCHQPERAFSDGRPVARGIHDRAGTRNAPTLVNAVFHMALFWDGRRASLEGQARDPFVNPLEHGLPDHAAVLSLVRRDPVYAREFEAVFGVKASAISMDDVAKAVASFVRSLVTGDSGFDRYFYGKDRSALGESQQRGLALFRGRAQCAACHTIGERYATFSDEQFHYVGIGLDRVAARLASVATRVVHTPKEKIDSLIVGDPEVAALGRFVVTLDPADMGKFRTPTLRNVALTAPYMHDGSIATLEEAADHELYYRGQESGRPLILTPAERNDLVAFLKSLTSSSLPH